jgi:hypothetical protein
LGIFIKANAPLSFFQKFFFKPIGQFFFYKNTVMGITQDDNKDETNNQFISNNI